MSACRRNVSNSQIDLSWTDNSNDETGFKIERAIDSMFTTGVTTTSIGANVTRYGVRGLSAATTCYSRVREAASAENSAFTVPVTVKTQVSLN